MLEDKKSALRMFQYGMFILTAKATKRYEETPYAATTVTWVSQASFEPPLIMLALRKEGWALDAVRQSNHFVLHILSKSQKDMAKTFFKETKISLNKINGFEFELTSQGIPILEEVSAYLECETEEFIDRGDHTVLIARILDAKVRHAMEPMLLRETGWSYGG